jgi:hypothetical protein
MGPTGPLSQVTKPDPRPDEARGGRPETQNTAPVAIQTKQPPRCPSALTTLRPKEARCRKVPAHRAPFLPPGPPDGSATPQPIRGIGRRPEPYARIPPTRRPDTTPPGPSRAAGTPCPWRKSQRHRARRGNGDRALGAAVGAAYSCPGGGPMANPIAVACPTITPASST